jgi:sialidase-1
MIGTIDPSMCLLARGRSTSNAKRDRGRFAVSLVVALAGVVGGLPALDRADGGVTMTTVFQSGAEGYNTYRIPTVVEAANGDLLAFVEARDSLSDTGVIDLVMKRSTDRGTSWGPLQVVVDSQQYANLFPAGSVPPLTAGNPAPVVDRTDPAHPGRVWLPWTLEQDRVFVMYSDDNGGTWSQTTEVTPTVKDPSWGWIVTGPVHGIQLERGPDAGRLIIPSDHRLADVSSWGSDVMYSDDHGQTWQIGAVDTHLASSPVHPNEHVAVELVDGSIYFNARDQGGSSPENRAKAYSSDGGLTFDAPFSPEPQITTPVVQNSIVRLAAVDQGDAQNILLYSGPGRASSRSDMTIHVSFDEGLTWTLPTVIHPGPAAYSDLVALGDLRAGVLYEAGATLYDEIDFASFDFEDLDPAPWNGIVGDVNQDGTVDSMDLDAFIAAWNPTSNMYFLGGADSYRNGDLDFDGRQSLRDVFILRQALPVDGVDAADLQRLNGVPEPAAGVIAGMGLAIALLGLFGRRLPRTIAGGAMTIVCFGAAFGRREAARIAAARPRCRRISRSARP